MAKWTTKLGNHKTEKEHCDSNMYGFIHVRHHKKTEVYCSLEFEALWVQSIKDSNRLVLTLSSKLRCRETIFLLGYLTPQVGLPKITVDQRYYDYFSNSSVHIPCVLGHIRFSSHMLSSWLLWSSWLHFGEKHHMA